MSLPNKHVTSLLLLCATHALAFPFYMDVGGLSNTTLLSPTVPNVEYHHIFECPHPCGLVSHFDKNGNDRIDIGEFLAFCNEKGGKDSGSGDPVDKLRREVKRLADRGGRRPAGA